MAGRRVSFPDLNHLFRQVVYSGKHQWDNGKLGEIAGDFSNDNKYDNDIDKLNNDIRRIIVYLCVIIGEGNEHGSDKIR